MPLTFCTKASTCFAGLAGDTIKGWRGEGTSGGHGHSTNTARAAAGAGVQPLGARAAGLRGMGDGERFVPMCGLRIRGGSSKRSRQQPGPTKPEEGSRRMCKGRPPSRTLSPPPHSTIAVGANVPSFALAHRTNHSTAPLCADQWECMRFQKVGGPPAAVTQRALRLHEESTRSEAVAAVGRFAPGDGSREGYGSTLRYGGWGALRWGERGAGLEGDRAVNPVTEGPGGEGLSLGRAVAVGRRPSRASPGSWRGRRTGWPPGFPSSPRGLGGPESPTLVPLPSVASRSASRTAQAPGRTCTPKNSFSA